ncbi:chorismate mutase [Oerskovia sp. M15]
MGRRPAPSHGPVPRPGQRGRRPVPSTHARRSTTHARPGHPGATQLDVDEREHLFDRTRELVQAVLDANAVDTASLISIFFTCTPDLVADFPAAAAGSWASATCRSCARSRSGCPGATRVVRLMAHAELDVARADVQHVYLHGATSLRKDLAQ